MAYTLFSAHSLTSVSEPTDRLADPSKETSSGSRSKSPCTPAVGVVLIVTMHFDVIN